MVLLYISSYCKTTPSGETGSAEKMGATTLPTNMYKVFPKVPKKPTTTSMEQLLDEAQMSQQCLEAVKIVDKGTSIIMQRSLKDIHVNNYNPVILKALRSNMDIQFIRNIWACIAYLTFCVFANLKEQCLN